MVALYSIHIATNLLPLLTLPYLARILAPPTFGRVAFFQSLSQTMALIIEFGFNYSGTRAAARARDDTKQRAEVLQSVLSAKLFLILVIVLLSGLGYLAAPSLQSDAPMFATSISWAIFQGLSLAWYLLGIGRIILQASLDFATRIMATLLIFGSVHAPSDAWKVFALYTLAAATTFFVTLCFAAKGTRLLLPRPQAAISAIKSSYLVFFSRVAVSVYTLATAFLLGLYVNSNLVAYYTGAEKLARGAIGLLIPLNQVVYSALTYQLAHNPDRGRRLAQIALFFQSAVGIALAAGLFFGARFLVRIVLGRGFESAVPLVRLFALLPIFSAVSTGLGAQWMLALDLDSAFTRIVATAGGVSLVSTVLLVPRFQQVGMCYAVLITEGYLALACIWYLVIKRLHPFAAHA